MPPYIEVYIMIYIKSSLCYFSL